jgi:hypothetical protein
MDWITDWSEIDSDETYIVCPVNTGRSSKQPYLGQPQMMKGWQVQRLIPRLYAALPMPAFKGFPPQEGRTDAS